MGRETGISWTRSTRNFWSGCTKVGPGCDGCYAEASSRRMRGVDEITLQAKNWGPGAPRVAHLEGADRDLRKWNKLAALERGGHPKARSYPGGVFTEGWPRPGFWPVFLNSYSDVLDNEVDDLWRGLLFTTAEECEYLNPQLVTKRIGNALRMFPGHWLRQWPAHVWLLITVVNQEELDRDGPKLMQLADMAGIRVIGFSFEPQIGEIDARPFLELAHQREQIVWGITGGESSQPGHPARPYVLGWAKRIVRDFGEFGQPVFVKQLGTHPVNREGEPHLGITGKGDDPSQWPEELRVQQFPT